MKNTWKSSVLLIGTAMLGAVALSGTNVMAGVLDVEVTVDIVNSTVETNPTPLHFGNINADPAGDVITLEAAGAAFSAGISNGAITYTGNSVLSGSPTEIGRAHV